MLRGVERSVGVCVCLKMNDGCVGRWSVTSSEETPDQMSIAVRHTIGSMLVTPAEGPSRCGNQAASNKNTVSSKVPENTATYIH